LTASTTFNEGGFIILCDKSGKVLDAVYDGLKVVNRVPEGSSWLKLVDEASLRKAQNFHSEILSQGAVFDWVLSILTGSGVLTLRFSGVCHERIIIAAARTNQGVARLFDFYIEGKGEQSDHLRQVTRDFSEFSLKQAEKDSALYDELSRLNNELGVLQRELARKNVKLEELNALKNHFLGMAAHDLRKPAQVVMMFAEILMDELGPDRSTDPRSPRCHHRDLGNPHSVC